jgi:hypothetical protein
MKMKNTILLFSIAVVFSFITGAIVSMVLRQHDYSVPIHDAIIGNGDRQLIELAGSLRPVSDNRFLLVDKTGSVMLETCPTWYRKITPKDLRSVHVTGVVTVAWNSKGYKHTYVEVYRFIWPDGTETVIRPSLGKPPWAFSASQPQPVN